MSKNSKTYCLLDTETTYNNQDVFNLGYLILNKKGYIIQEDEMVFTDIIDKDPPFYVVKPIHGKIYQIPQTAKRVNSLEGLAILKNVLQENNVSAIVAYNAMFDVRVIEKLIPDFFEGMEIIDLWSLSCFLICGETYIKWAIRNKKFSDKGNVKTSAEVVYQYISSLENFEEKHTALSDCYIELEIFRSLLRKKENIANFENDSHPWKMVRDKWDYLVDCGKIKQAYKKLEKPTVADISAKYENCWL